MIVDDTAPDRGPFVSPPDRGCAAPAPVDLLFVVDNTSSMSEEHEALAAQLPRLLTRLVSPPDSDGDGAPDAIPVTDIHLGVVTADMGAGSFPVPTCPEPFFGDDGVLRTRSGASDAGCAPAYPPFISYAPGGDPLSAARDLACVASVGTTGCRFEQPLEAALKAVTPSSSYVRFQSGTVGNGDTVNGGFVRSDSLLAIVVLSDAEDCSVFDPELFNPDSFVYPGDLSLRCFQYPAAVQAIARYVDGLLVLREERPDLLAYGLIAGIPARLFASGASPSIDAILSDPEMEEQIDPAMPTRLRASCTFSGRTIAAPPRRLVTVARGLEERGAAIALGSICEPDFARSIDSIAQTIGSRACLSYSE